MILLLAACAAPIAEDRVTVPVELGLDGVAWFAVGVTASRAARDLGPIVETSATGALADADTTEVDVFVNGELIDRDTSVFGEDGVAQVRWEPDFARCFGPGWLAGSDGTCALSYTAAIACDRQTTMFPEFRVAVWGSGRSEGVTVSIEAAIAE
jgi:hypothetical protein